MEQRESSKRIIITGGSGFIGTNAIDMFLKLPGVIVNFDINPPKKDAHLPFWKKVDIRDTRLLEKEMRDFNPTHILHLAAALGMDVRDLTFFDANTEGVKNILASTALCPMLQRIVFTSSLLVCRNGYIPKSDVDYCPPNLYGQSKMIGEQLVRAFPPSHFSWSIVRPTSVWGPWFAYSYRSFFKSIHHGYYFHLGNTSIFKPSSFVGNTVHMMHSILFGEEETVNGKTFYLADYPSVTTREWAEVIREEMGKRPIRQVPLWIFRMMGYFGDVLKLTGWEDPPMSSFRLTNMLTGGIYPVENTRHVCGSLPFTLREGVRETIHWMREAGDMK